MKQLNIETNFIKKTKKYKTIKQLFKNFENKIRYVKINHFNQVWVQDITEIKMVNKKAYLATVMDLYSRKILSYELSLKKDTELIVRVLNNAIKIRKPQIGIFIHSDKGLQYRSKKYIKTVESIGGILSYTRYDYSCADNACQESFHASLKKEDIYLNPIKNFEEAKERIRSYIEDFYNKKRIHSKLNNLSPIEFEEKNIDKFNISNDINLQEINRIDLKKQISDYEKNLMYKILYEIGYRENKLYDDLNLKIKNFIDCENKNIKNKIDEENKIVKTKSKARTVANKNKKLIESFTNSIMQENSKCHKNKFNFLNVNNDLYVDYNNFIKNIKEIPELSNYNFYKLSEYDVDKLKLILNHINNIN